MVRRNRGEPLFGVDKGLKSVDNRVDHMLDQATLKEWVHYDPETGMFSRIKRFVRGSRYRRTETISPEPYGLIDSQGYVTVQVATKRYRGHRLAFLYMTGKWPERDADHINRNRADNRWCNLREATRAQNLANAVQRRGKSGVRGVRYSKGHWWAMLSVRRGKEVENRFLGNFETIEEAKRVYDEAARAEWGEYYRP